MTTVENNISLQNKFSCHHMVVVGKIPSQANKFNHGHMTTVGKDGKRGAGGAVDMYNIITLSPEKALYRRLFRGP
jgi:hypothetical protein